MPAYSPRSLQSLLDSMSSIASRFFDRLPLILTPDEFIPAFIAPEHIQTLREVEELVGYIVGGGGDTSIALSDGQALRCQLNFGGGRPPIILPRYVQHGLQPTCPEAVRSKLTDWADERVRLGYIFGDAYDALVHLNQICSDPRAMRILLPCLPFVMDSISDDPESPARKRAATLAKSKSFPPLPALPLAVKQRLAEVSAVVNSASLMFDAPTPVPERKHCLVRYHPYNSASVPVRTNLFYQSAPARSRVPTAKFL